MCSIEPEIELHGVDTLVGVPYINCLFIGHSFIARLRDWLLSASNPYMNGLGISKVDSYSWLAFPGGSVANNSTAILSSKLVPAAHIIILDLAGNDLDSNISESDFIQYLKHFISLLKQAAPSAVIICLQLLKRFKCRSKMAEQYNSEVVKINKELMQFYAMRNDGVWWWLHKGLWGNPNVYDFDGVHLSCRPLSEKSNESGMLRYVRSIRGAVLGAIKARYE